MTQYKLVDTNRGNEIIDLMHNYTHSMLSDVFRIPNELNLDGDDYEALHDQLLDDHNNNLAHVEYCNPNQSTNQLNSFLTDDVLSIDEALFCILGLNITSKPHNFSILNLNKHKNNKALDSVISNTNEYRKLTKAIIAEESAGLPLVKSQYIYTKQFISWAIDKGFIEETNNKSNTGNIVTSHNQERDLIADHNIKVSLEEYEAWIPIHGKSKNPSAFTNNSIAWSKLEARLKPLLNEDDAGNRVMPEKSTIAQYIRNDINSKKS